MNLIEPILYQCKLNPFATAIATPGSGINSIKYGQLENLIHNVARAAIKAGLTPGDVAALYIGDSILHAVVIFGLMRIGVVTMSLAEASLPDRIAVNAVVTDAPQLFPVVGNVLAVNASWLQGDGTPLDYERIYRCKDEDICSINLTSGSTGRRKGIVLTHAMLAGRASHYGYSKGRSFARMSRLYCSFGISTTPGYTYLCYVLSHGGTIYFSGTDIAAVLQYAAPHRIQGLVTSPYNLDGLLKFFEADPALECSFEAIICQGARLSRELANHVRSRMCQNLFTSYGSTETATCVFGPAEITSKIPGAVGFVCPGYSIDVVDANERVLPAGQEGSVRIRSPYIASGYLSDPEASAQMFRNGAFYIGDRGYLTADGILVITGREKTVLLISGDSIAPEIIEEVLCGFAGINQAAVCTVDDALGIAQVHALIVARPDVDEAAVRAYCESKLRKVFVPESFIRVEAIPRGGQGKIDRPRVFEIAKAAAKRA
jgi:acyl-CoA synthetase (AMP-forming)/AMP-acid ligase II